VSQGTGLGLAIANGFARLMGGYITAQSEHQVGSEFTFSAKFELTKPELSVQSKEREVPNLVGKSILVAEDNPINVKVIEKLLSLTGAQIDTAYDGQQCVELFEKSAKGKYSVIFMDIRMPNMDGYEAAAKIRQSLHPDGRFVQICALTADVFSNDVKLSEQAGMNFY
ncbi:MAG: response regulator, partial [Oscillospiraceae bacterium]